MNKVLCSARVGLILLIVPVCSAEKVRINEIMYHPGFGRVGDAGYVAEDTRKEYIELYNPGANAVNLAGWRFDKGIAFVFPDVTIAAQGYLVVAADSDLVRFKNSYLASYAGVSSATVVGGWTGTLGNNGNTLELVDRLGQRVDQVTYASNGDWGLRREGDPYAGHPTWWRGWQWTSGADAGGKSLELINPAVAKNQGQNWAASLKDGGTPGGPNSVASANTAPLILDVKHRPAIPQSTNTVAITARLVDELATNLTATLHHRLDGAAGFTTAAMFDDGLHDDGAAGDGVFGAVLPAQPDQTIVEFYVQAADGSGPSRTWPGPSNDQGAQRANALYQVDDSVYTGRQPIYRLIIPNAEWSAWVNLMDTVSGGQYSDAMMNATFIAVDGSGEEVRYGASVRNRGAGTRAAHPHNLHVMLPGDRPWRNQTTLALNTRTVHSQVAANALHVLSGVPSEYGAPVQVRVNGNNLAHLSPSGATDSYQFGSYFAFQPYGNEWLDRHYPTDPGGNIYKGVWNFDGHSLQHSANLDYLGANVASYRQAYSPTGPTSSSGPYLKQNHAAEDDWSDLIHLCEVLDQAPDATLVEQIRPIVNLDEWLSYVAVTALAGNRETTFGTGTGDDYSLYRGVKDPRFVILPHDMDTTLGQGSSGADYGRSIFEACAIPALNRLLKHPAIAPRYFAILRQQADRTFAPERVNPLLDQVLGEWVPADYLQNMKEYVVARRAGVLAQIPARISVTTTLPVVSGYLKATGPTASLSGKAEGIRTRWVKVNGLTASWTAWTATWSISNLPLNPGVNRVVIQSFDENQQETEQLAVDLWYDKGSVTTVAGGNLTANTTWTAANGPYLINAHLTVNSGVTLTIQPGATVYFGSGVKLTVANGGRLLAEGADQQPIRLTSPPGAGTRWGGLTINGAAGSPETRLAHVHLELNDSTAIHATAGTLFFDHLTFGSTDHQYLSLDGSSFVVQNCVFPATTASFEPVHGTGGIKSGGHGIFLRNFWGPISGYNDSIDFTGGQRPGPIVQFLDNVFMGTGDDFLDLDNTDAWVEGNLFLHAHKNGTPDTSSAVSGGNDTGEPSDITIVGNIIYDCDQAANAKQDNFFTMVNNTIVHQSHQGGLDTEGAVVCLADNGMSEGKGIYLEGNIIFDAEQPTRAVETAVVTFTNNLLPWAWNGPGGNNSTADPQFHYVPQLAETYFTNWAQAQILRDWFRLRPGSPAIGSGPGGRDLGVASALGLGLGGEPLGTTFQNSATLTVGPWMKGNSIPATGFPNGSGFTHYQWKLDDGVFSAEIPASTPIVLNDLPNGPHTVTAIGKNDAGYYQNNPLYDVDAGVSQSRTWMVEANRPGRVRLNEILAYNLGAFSANGTYPDAVELFNDGAQPIDLSGLGLSNSPTNKFRYVLPGGTTLGSGQYLVLLADNATNAPGLHLGFGLDRSGDALYLHDRQGTLVDAVTFGRQVANFSIGRLPSGDWDLTEPTLGAPNLKTPQGDPGSLKINEWLAVAQISSPADFIELYNPNSAPVALGGLILCDQSVGQPGFPAIAPLSFLAAKGFALFYADNRPDQGLDHLGFTLSPEPSAIGLFAADLSPIDLVYYGPQSTDVSQGRTPNGAGTIESFPKPTPGAGNPGNDSTVTLTTQTIPLIPNTHVWKYNQTSIPGADWWAPSYTGDAAWPAGAALLYVEGNSLPWPKNTPLTLGRNTYYFRTHFQVATNLTGAILNLRAIIDDGAVFYLNGKEVLRLHIDANAVVTYDTHASDHESALEGPFTSIPVSNLHQGDNVMAVEVHQVNSGSSDVVFGLALEATLTTTNGITNTTPRSVALNELRARNLNLANPTGLAADWVELYNPAETARDMADMSLTDDVTTPRKWVFPANSTIPARGFLLVYCNGSSNASSTNTGFGLKSTGGSLALFDAVEREGKLLDSVTYGLQVADLSIGRIGVTGTWALTQPTPNAPNAAAALGNPMTLKINEWLANPLSGDDWFELFNPEARPVELSGLRLTDDLAKPDPSPIPALSFIGAGAAACQKFIADGAPTQGADHASFKLSSAGELIALLTTNLLVIDQIAFGPQTAGVAQGRFPDGSTKIVFFPGSATPGWPNSTNSAAVDTDGDGLPDAWELAHGFNPNNPSDALADSDSDGASNLEEFLAGTDPNDAESALKLTFQWDSDHNGVIRFTAQAGKSYVVQYRNSLTVGEWLTLLAVPPNAVATPIEVTHLVTSDSMFRVYRVVLIPP